MIGIYKIENTVNQKVYIGQSKNIEERWKSHIRASKSKNSVGYNYYIHKAFRKYGINKFHFSVLEECGKNELNDREEYWIRQYRSVESKYGYNLTKGGDNTAFHLQRPIYQIDLDTKEIINRFDSCFEAGRCLGKSQANIRHCCDGDYNYAYGFLWRYVDDYSFDELIKLKINKNRSAHSLKSKDVIQLDMETGEIINEYINSKVASDKTGISRSAIVNCLCNLSKSSGGFIWKYKQESEVN